MQEYSKTHRNWRVWPTILENNFWTVPNPQLHPPSTWSQIIKLARTSKLFEAKDLQYKVLRNTCLTNNTLFNMNILESSACRLCNHPTQNSTHRFYSCHHIVQVRAFLFEITENIQIQHSFSLSDAILNVQNVPKNHPLVLITNYTRLIIDRAHTNSSKTHQNTFLDKFLHLAEIFQLNDAKFPKIW